MDLGELWFSESGSSEFEFSELTEILAQRGNCRGAVSLCSLRAFGRVGWFWLRLTGSGRTGSEVGSAWTGS